mgnify:CR=1 FL=1
MEREEILQYYINKLKEYDDQIRISEAEIIPTDGDDKNDSIERE